LDFLTLFYSKLCCLDLSILQRPLLSLDMPVLQHPVIPLDVPVLQQPELPLDVSDLQKSLIPVDGSVLQLFIFNSCCRTGISGEDLSRNSRGLCKQTRTKHRAEGCSNLLETGARQHNDAEKQRTAEAKAAREAALAKLRERQQKRLRDAQELTKCLSSGMDLLTPGQVRQITDAATETGNEPMDALRSFGERLRILREESPQASEADLREAVEGAMRVIVTRAKEEREQRKRPGTQQVAAAFEVPREVMRLPEARRAARQNIPGPPSGRTLRGAESEVEQMHTYISRIRTNLHKAIGNRDGQKYRDEFNIEHVPKQRMEYEDSVPMERRPTLPVADVLSVERQERSWESAPGSRWLQPAMVDRSRGIGDLGMAGLNIGAPEHL
jgi:hypothetical protein